MNYRRQLGFLVAVVLLAPTDLAAQQIVPTGDGRVSVVAERVPLEKLLDRFAQLVDLRMRLEPGIGERIVTITLEPTPIVDALRKILSAAEVDFVLSAGAAKEPMKLRVGDVEGPDGAPAEFKSATAEQPTEAVTTPVEDRRERDETEDERAGDTVTRGNPAPPTISPSERASPERLVQLLAPVLQPKPAPGALIPLPFPGLDGQLLTAPYDPAPPGIVRLPFPDALGRPMEIVVPVLPPGQVDLPFPSVPQPSVAPSAPSRGSAKPRGSN